MMRRSSLLAVFAWYFDLVLIESVVWPLHDLVDVKEGALYHLSVLVRVIVFIVSIAYHVKWKNSTQWLSPGEYLTGQRLISGNKEGVMMYNIHRTVMFLVLLINMLCTAKTFDVSYYGLDASWIVLLMNYGFNFILLFGVLKLAAVKIEGVLSVVIALSFIVGNHAVDYFSLGIQSSRNSFVSYLLLLVANVGVYFYYKKHQMTNQLSVSVD